MEKFRAKLKTGFKTVGLVLIFLAILFSQAGFVLAAGSGCGGAGQQDKTTILFCPPSKHKKIEQLVEAALAWFFYVGITIAPLMILVGAFVYMTAAGEQRRLDKGKQIIKWALIGLAVVIFSKALISIVKTIFNIQ